ncbi:PA14 domain protein [Stieleria maiorica]|uniref:PA14 domain protein n=1 Tax=Stieleria maiorica TaxID=2795974 RepID=A0A5B9MAJ3_9BACT|nr:DUF1592 domain-containing protein [Stieleria maiorica]QEF98311.1 PA14 domain protein [Stieleria maiorica]
MNFARRIAAFITVAVCLCGVSPVTAPAEDSVHSAHSNQPLDIAAVYKEKCQRCHGAHGQGTNDGYSKPLRTDRAIEEITRVIEETMPEEAPESCVGEEATQLARYIREELTDGKSSHAVPKLTRLTVAQYRNSIADLLAHFTPQPESESPNGRDRGRSRGNAVPGLRGEYYQSEGMNKAHRLGHYRSETRLEFDFGSEAPVPSLPADQFAIIWQGSLIAEHTGEYFFRLTTENGARLYLNFDPRPNTGSLRDDRSSGDNEAFIDDWVGSGKRREKSASMFLLGGRSYPIRLEFFKYLEDRASVKLEWKPPHGTWSVLDYNHTSTAESPRTFACGVPFPADDRSLGFERGSSVSPQWQTAVMQGAVQTASEVVSRLPLLANLQTNESRAEAITRFVHEFAQVAYRRPLHDDESVLLASLITADKNDLESGVRKAVALVLLSPHFLYPDLIDSTAAALSPEQRERLAPWGVASKLSFALWDSLPDRDLVAAAESGRLDSPEGIESYASRMLRDRRAKSKLRRFFSSWLEIEDRDLSKDTSLYPEFDDAVVADLRRSLELFIDSVVWSRDSDYRQLLLAPHLMLNERLEAIYAPSRAQEQRGASGEEIKRLAKRREFASAFQPVDFDKSERSGILTHPYLMSAFAYHNNTSPIHRGVFLTRNIVGRALSPPPNAIAFDEDKFPDDLTMREKVTLLTRDTACMACHSVINPLGFTLEHFDAVGRWRKSDNAKPIDSESDYTTTDGETLRLTNARDVAEFAVNNPAAHVAFITHLYEHLLQQSAHEAGPERLNQLRDAFAKDDFNIQKLCARLAVLAVDGAGSSNALLTENAR